MSDARPAEPGLVALIGYALPALPLALLTLPLYVIVPNHYAALGVPIATVGFVLLLVRLFDAGTDPLVGFLSDRLTSRFGRRRTWFLAGVPLTALAAYMVFSPPDGPTAGYLLLWSFALSLGWTIALIPYQAWGAELSETYDGRNRVAAFREGLTFLGTLAALIMQFAIGNLGATLAVFALVVGIGLPLTALVAVSAAPEPANRSRTKLALKEGYRAILGNRPFIRLLAAYLVNGLANGLPATLFLFFVADRLELGEKAGLFLVVYFLAGLIGMPIWLYVARITSKQRSWCIAMLIACAAFAIAPFLGPGAEAAFLVVCILTGVAVGADLALPASIQADVIDIDTATSGEQRSGLYVSLWALATKLALALAVGIAFPVLAASGFDPGEGIRTETGLVVLGLLYAALPILLKLIAIGLMWTFPIDAASQATVRNTINAEATVPQRASRV
jgi:glycoside/pentoside/hexuronide:cation symporter, GPH family